MKAKIFEVEVIRGSQIESRHRVAASIYSRNKNYIDSFGDDNLIIYPRSSLKPIQALPLIITKTAENFQLGDQELALACASHRGESFHISILQNWMKKAGIKESFLECGIHPPANSDSHCTLIKSNIQASPIHNNCSGKHIGMISTALYLKEPIKNYVSLNHPVQKRILQSIEKLCKVHFNQDNLGIDGCSIPAPAISLRNLAIGFCELIDPIHLNSIEVDATIRVFNAFITNPFLTSGTGHYCSEMMTLLHHDQVLLKGGAEGVMAGAIPKLKLGFALKTLDGNARATEFCTSVLLNKLGFLSEQSPYLKPNITNWNQIETGSIRLARHD